MEPNTKKIRGPRTTRLLRSALPALWLAGSLTACGGGGGGGGGSGAPAPQACASQTSHGDGFALGSCAATFTNVFQPIDSPVNVAGPDGYTLSLVFPAALQSLTGSTPFTAANRPPASERNIIGVLRGQAYENPTRAALTPPYVALTDFFQAWDYQQDTTAPKKLELTYASFGTWEKFAGSGSAGFNEGYLGTWFAARPASTENTWPTTTPVTYTGFVVGVIGPDGSSNTPALIGRFGFSGPITINVTATGIASASIASITVSFQTSASPNLTVTQLDIKPIGFSASAGASPGAMTGALTTDSAGPGTNVTLGSYEARHFGTDGHVGEEIAGRIRFRTSNGLIGVGAFGAKR